MVAHKAHNRGFQEQWLSLGLSFGQVMIAVGKRPEAENGPVVTNVTRGLK
jgi:hypothetical protein